MDTIKYISKFKNILDIYFITNLIYIYFKFIGIYTMKNIIKYYSYIKLMIYSHSNSYSLQI